MTGLFECGDLIRKFANNVTWMPKLDGLGLGALIICSILVLRALPTSDFETSKRQIKPMYYNDRFHND